MLQVSSVSAFLSEGQGHWEPLGALQCSSPCAEVLLWSEGAKTTLSKQTIYPASCVLQSEIQFSWTLRLHHQPTLEELKVTSPISALPGTVAKHILREFSHRYITRQFNMDTNAAQTYRNRKEMLYSSSHSCLFQQNGAKWKLWHHQSY